MELLSRFLLGAPGNEIESSIRKVIYVSWRIKTQCPKHSSLRMASSSCRTCIFDELAGNSLGDLTLEPVLGYHMLVPKVNSQEELFHWVSRTTNICYSLCLLETQSRHLIHGLVHSVDPDIVFAVDQEPRTDP